MLKELLNTPMIEVEQTEVDKFAKAVGDYVQKIHDEYDINKKQMQYMGLYQYCVSHFNIKKRTIFKWRGIRIKNFLKYIQKKKVQTRKEVDLISGYEYCIYAIDGNISLICKHYMKADLDGIIEKHSVIIL
jgi:hypothetical protein